MQSNFLQMQENRSEELEYLNGSHAAHATTPPADAKMNSNSKQNYAKLSKTLTGFAILDRAKIFEVRCLPTNDKHSVSNPKKSEI